MVEINVSTTSAPTPSAPVQPSSADPTTAGHAAQANKTGKGYDKDTTISSVAELRTKAPEVYKKMMEGLAMSIIGKMRKSQERLKKMWREIHQK